MVFSSIPFLYYFLPVVLVLYFIAPRGLKNPVLLVSSLVFYGWGEPKYVFLMVLTVLQAYVFGLLIEKKRGKFLSKLYLAPEVQGKGIAVKTLEFIKDKAKKLNKQAVYLTVNKGNARAILVYEKFGFKRIDSVVTDIGNCFVMDDYIYQLDV